MQSVSTLLEQLIVIANDQLATTKEILQNAQATNGKLAEMNATLSLVLRLTKKSLAVAEETLESSKRIEILLGGAAAPVPASMKVEYQFTLKE